MKERLGFIGLGQMGRWMVLNFLKAGFELTIYDVNPQAMDFLTDQGVQSTPSAAHLASQPDWVFLSLPNTEIVETVLFGEAVVVKGARPGLVVVDCGTTGYLPTLELEHRLTEKGIYFSDAPVSGMEARAREGTLTIMFGGDEAIFYRVRSALDAMGNRVVYMGPVGSGQLTKLVNQILFNITAAAIANEIRHQSGLC